MTLTPVNLYVAVTLLGDYIKSETMTNTSDGPTDIVIEWNPDESLFQVDIRWWHHDGAIVEFSGKHVELTVAIGIAFNELKLYQNTAAKALKELTCPDQPTYPA